MSAFESFDLLNVIPACMCIHHYLPQGLPCTGKTACSFPVLHWD